jgi:hypothetical protein
MNARSRASQSEAAIIELDAMFLERLRPGMATYGR